MIFDCDGVNVWFSDFDTRRITGFNTQIKLGDRVRCQMQSGKTAEFEVAEIKHMSDPRDQYFATVKDVKYIEANP